MTEHNKEKQSKKNTDERTYDDDACVLDLDAEDVSGDDASQCDYCCCCC